MLSIIVLEKKVWDSVGDPVEKKVEVNVTARTLSSYLDLNISRSVAENFLDEFAVLVLAS